jgi:hypothetical protein
VQGDQKPIVPKDPADISNARVISWRAKRRRDQMPIVPEDPASLVVEGESAAVRVHIKTLQYGESIHGKVFAVRQVIAQLYIYSNCTCPSFFSLPVYMCM